MGEVYRARDTKLNREVAIKVLPAALATDADYMARFQREAQVLASLNHPNIAAIYGLEDHAIVMELVEGPTLADRIAEGPPPVEDALPIAQQIVEALEAAHEKGIVHRDLKPGNVKVTPEGVVKVLDFGLAKAADANNNTSSASISPTLTIRATEAGLILGTAGYMSPEQATGRPVDKRADIWSFGVVLWEMLTGKRLFEGETISHTLAHVLTAPIDFNQIPAKTPPAVRELLRRCLDRVVKNRLRDIGEARIALQKDGTSTVTALSQQRPWILRLIASLLAIALLAAGVGWYRASRPAPLSSLIRVNLDLPANTPFLRGFGGNFALSPDGSRLAVVLRNESGKLQLYTRLLNQSQANPLAGTENAGNPFFSPDARWIGFFADNKLKKISVDGGAAVTLCDAPVGRGASWGEDGNIVAALNSQNTALTRIPSAGGSPTPVTKLRPGEVTHRWPQVLPGGKAILFTASGTPGNFNDADIDLISLETGEQKTIQRGGFYPRYFPISSETGYLLYLHQSTLFAMPFDLRRLAPAGSSSPILEDVSSNGSAGGDLAFAAPNATGHDLFVYLSGGPSEGRFINWIFPSGSMQPLLQPGSYFTPKFSPDGKRLAFSMITGSGEDVWVRDLGREASSRLTFLPGVNRAPVWTPDGKSIVFSSTNPTAPGIYWIRSDGSGEVQRLTDGKLIETPSSFSPNGKYLAFSQPGNGGSEDIFIAPFEGDSKHPRLGKAELFLGTQYDERHPVFSPDGRWIAYQSDESGPFQIYVRPFPGPGGRWQVSTGGGLFPTWSPSRELLFETSPDSRVMASPYAAQGDSFTSSVPRLWSESHLFPMGLQLNYDLAPDGKRLAAIVAADEATPVSQLTLLVNFGDELRRRMARK
jgi:serine/threonine-protein kinase